MKAERSKNLKCDFVVPSSTLSCWFGISREDEALKIAGFDVTGRFQLKGSRNLKMRLQDAPRKLNLLELI
jgi:hypothetical protein